MVAEDRNRLAGDCLKTLDAEQTGPWQQDPIGNCEVNPSRERLGRIVGPLVTGVPQPPAQRDERVGTRVVQLPIEAETDVFQCLGILRGEERHHRGYDRLAADNRILRGFVCPIERTWLGRHRPCVYGSSRIRMFRNSTGAPSASRQRYPLRGAAPLPPDTSSPFTQSRISPSIART